jgi:hypothetical protein
MAIIASTPDLTDAQDLARVEARLHDDTANRSGQRCERRR